MLRLQQWFADTCTGCSRLAGEKQIGLLPLPLDDSRYFFWPVPGPDPCRAWAKFRSRRIFPVGPVTRRASELITSVEPRGGENVKQIQGRMTAI